MHPQNNNVAYLRYLKMKEEIKRGYRESPDGLNFRVNDKWISEEAFRVVAKTLLGERDKLVPSLRKSLCRIADTDTFLGKTLGEEDVRFVNCAIQEVIKHSTINGIVYCLGKRELGLITQVKQWANYFNKGKFTTTREFSSSQVLGIRQDFGAYYPGVLFTTAEKRVNGGDSYVKNQFREPDKRLALIRLDQYVARADPSVYVVDGLRKLVPIDRSN